MSFILDALKKSENERQRKVGPSLADVHVRPAESNRPWWAVAIAALLLINLGVLIVALTRSHESKQTPTPVASQSSTSESSSANVQARAQPPVNPTPQVRAPNASSAPPPTESLPTTSAAVRSLAEEAGVASGAANEPSDAPSDSLAAAALPPAGPPVVRPIEAPNVTPASSPATFSSRTQESKQTNEVLPTASDLIAGGTQLPELHLDIHVHAANPADRFVFVNMHKYVEGQAMSEGPVVERITPDGVILNLHGLRFLLPHT